VRGALGQNALTPGRMVASRAVCQLEDTRMNRVSVATALLGLVVACGGANKAETSTAKKEKSGGRSSPASNWQPAPLPDDGPIKILGLTGPDTKPWDDMSYDEKEWYMIGKVHPIMRQVFQTYNHDKYEGEKFECVPCHGENPEAKKYKMPSDHLSKVPKFGSDDWKAMENSRVFKFMNLRVTPAMGKVIGKEEWDPETGKGYSCWGCHPEG
jgi:hypothetical protein